MSYHLKLLRDAGVTCTRKVGTRCFVRLRRYEIEERFPGLLASVLLAAAEADGVGADVSVQRARQAAGRP